MNFLKIEVALKFFLRGVFCFIFLVNVRFCGRFGGGGLTNYHATSRYIILFFLNKNFSLIYGCLDFHFSFTCTAGKKIMLAGPARFEVTKKKKRKKIQNYKKKVFDLDSDAKSKKYDFLGGDLVFCLTFFCRFCFFSVCTRVVVEDIKFFSLKR
jgi:hypothetical protein